MRVHDQAHDVIHDEEGKLLVFRMHVDGEFGEVRVLRRRLGGALFFGTGAAGRGREETATNEGAFDLCGADSEATGIGNPVAVDDGAAVEDEADEEDEDTIVSRTHAMKRFPISSSSSSSSSRGVPTSLGAEKL